MRKKNALLLTVLLLLGILLSQNGYTASKPFYVDKVIKIIVTNPPGGGYDYYARMVAKFMEKYLPGSTIIIKNIPGAGNIIGLNAIYNAKSDGLTLGTFNRGMGLSQLAGVKGIKFDLTKMRWIGSPCTEMYSFIVSSKKYKTLDDVLKAEEVRVSSTGRASLAGVAPYLLTQMMGRGNLKLTTGYGTSESQMAIMRGEVDGKFTSWYSFTALIESGEGIPVLFIGDEKPSGYENVPLLQEIVKEEKNLPVVDLLTGMQLIGRPFAGPPNIPSDRLKILREAFKKSIQDKELIKEIRKTGKPVKYIDADEALRRSNAILKLPDDIVKFIRQAYGVK